MTSDQVAVVGGSLAGMAAAARLAKAGHPVMLFERSGRLGGSWASRPLPGSDVQVDDGPSVLAFPAPWRDLFRKSGRPLEAELARSGYALVPADPMTVRFADGSALTLPTDRGEQYTVMAGAYGSAVAGRWRDLLDRLDDVWQARRPLGLELEWRAEDLTRPVRRRLLAGRTVADLARDLDHPQLGALVRSVAYQQGSRPERTPAFAAVDLSVMRTFGHWQVEPLPGRDGDVGRSSVLTDALAGRLALRKVAVHLNSAVTGIVVEGGRAVAVRTVDGERPVGVVISTIDPWGTLDLLPGSALRTQRRQLRRTRPAGAPTVTHEPMTDAPVTRLSHEMRLTSDGVPVVLTERLAGSVGVRTLHDYTATRPTPGAGLAWSGWRSWPRRPPVSTTIDALFLAGPASPAGPQPPAVVLSGALAAYAAHARLVGP